MTERTETRSLQCSVISAMIELKQDQDWAHLRRFPEDNARDKQLS